MKKKERDRRMLIYNPACTEGLAPELYLLNVAVRSKLARGSGAAHPECSGTD